MKIHIHNNFFSSRKTRDAFNESDHPRADNGQFGAGAGKSSGSKVKPKSSAAESAKGYWTEEQLDNNNSETAELIESMLKENGFSNVSVERAGTGSIYLNPYDDDDNYFGEIRVGNHEHASKNSSNHELNAHVRTDKEDIFSQIDQAIQKLLSNRADGKKA